MYEEVKLSDKVKRANRLYTEAAIRNYEDKMKETPVKREHNVMAESIATMTLNVENLRRRYQSFGETVRNSLTAEALYKVFKESIQDQKILSDSTSTTIMRCIVNEYVQETGYDTILNRMKSASVPMYSMQKAINETAKKILEAADKDDEQTFVIKPEMKDDFYKALDYSDTEAISDTINDRVSDAMSDFIVANTKEHDDITNTLKDAQDKIASTPESNGVTSGLKEEYEYRAKREAEDIRRRPKSVFDAMVHSMCESAMKHKETTHKEFFTEGGHLDMGKIVDRTRLMYTFLEMLNTTKIEKIDENYIANVVSSFKE